MSGSVSPITCVTAQDGCNFGAGDVGGWCFGLLAAYICRASFPACLFAIPTPVGERDNLSLAEP